MPFNDAHTKAMHFGEQQALAVPVCILKLYPSAVNIWRMNRRKMKVDAATLFRRLLLFFFCVGNDGGLH